MNQTRNRRTAKKEPTIEQRLAYSGVAGAARRIGCSREHLSRVLHGSRKANDTVRRGLARMGITTTINGKKI